MEDCANMGDTLARLSGVKQGEENAVRVNRGPIFAGMTQGI
ncbi:MAG: hypothetical protein R3C68_07675 [Myxococcota bacterium]